MHALTTYAALTNLSSLWKGVGRHAGKRKEQEMIKAKHTLTNNFIFLMLIKCSLLFLSWQYDIVQLDMQLLQISYILNLKICPRPVGDWIIILLQ